MFANFSNLLFVIISPINIGIADFQNTILRTYPNTYNLKVHRTKTAIL